MGLHSQQEQWLGGTRAHVQIADRDTQSLSPFPCTEDSATRDHNIVATPTPGLLWLDRIMLQHMLPMPTRQWNKKVVAEMNKSKEHHGDHKDK
jgi:hypothetical protein